MRGLRVLGLRVWGLKFSAKAAWFKLRAQVFLGLGFSSSL